jgi:hypothetical protein
MNAVGANSNDWDKYFLLTNDINMAAYTYTTALIAPDTSLSYGFQGTKFTGVFDGAGFRIINLAIDTAGADNDYLGLFGYIDPLGQIKNLGIEDVSVTGGNSLYSGSNYLGGLVGYNDNGTISDCFSTGSVTGRGALGGLVGYNYEGTISNCYTTGSVTGGYSSDYLGGLVGYNSHGTISNCFSTGSVTGEDYLGGLCGGNSGTINNCFSTGSVTGGDDSFHLGGLVGDNYNGIIRNCYATGPVTGGDDSDDLGGLVGYNFEGTIENCYATGQVTGENNSDNLGGLAGCNSGTISDCFSTGSVTSGDFSYNLGGLCGYNSNTISNCFWDVNTSGLDTSAGGMGLTTEQMQDMFYYSINGWAGNTNWTMIQGQYPHLAWENAGGEYIPEPVIELTGSGTEQDPYQIQTVNDLQFMGLGSFLWDKHYILTADLDLAAAKLNRIGYDSSNSFNGVFDGNGHVIYNLALNLPYANYLGLFGCIGLGGQVKHLGIEDVNITGAYYLGGLAGKNLGTIRNCFSTGLVTGGGYLGGLVGSNGEGTISDCFSTVQVTGGNGSSSLGGLAGYNEGGTISNCYATGPVTGGDHSGRLGGLTGSNNGTIVNCYATGQVTGGDRSNELGGLVGVNDGTISNCYATGQVTGGDSSPRAMFGFFGGLVGCNDWSGTISDCYSTGTVTGGDYSECLGGLVGVNGGTIENSYAIGSVTAGNGSCDIGGLVGKNFDDTISDCFSTGSVTGGNDSRYLGGLVGRNYGTISDCFSTGSVTGGDNSWYLGGLVGFNDNGTISNCYATGQVTGGNDSRHLGGLVGYNRYSTISDCYSTGTVISGVDSRHLGGLVGWNYNGTINNCYAAGSVTGDDRLGGLAGYNEGTISNCYAGGLVTGVYNSEYLGGLVGWNHFLSSINHCFWDVNTSGLDTSAGGIGKTTEEMQMQSTFTDAGWDFTTPVWKICDGFDYPRLAWERYAGGSGTPEDPFLIRTPCQMNEIGTEPNDWDKHFLLTADINMAGFTYTTALIAPDTDSSTEGFQGTAFTGVFDGSGFKIINLRIYTASSNNDFLGLFGCIDSPGLIRNLGIEDVNITGGNDSRYLGGLAGYNDGTISNCYATGSVSGGDSSYNLGGLIGLNDEGIVSNCYATGLVIGGHESGGLGGLVGFNAGTISYCFSTGSITGDGVLGGLVGFNEYGIINDCFSAGQVTGNAFIGGLVGENNSGTVSNCHSTSQVTGGYESYYLGGLCGVNYSGTISNCFSTGQVTGDYYFGGLCGQNYSNSTISNCFWDVNTSGLDTSAGGTGKTTEQMQTISTFTDAGWDFVGETDNGIADIWRLCSDGVDYPKLSWQFLLGDFICPDGVDLLDLGVLTDNWLLPVLAGDLEKDGFVDFYDFAIFANAWQSDSGSPNWNPACDIAPDGGDGFVGIDDLLVFMTGWLQESATDGDIAPVPADRFVNFLDFTVFAENWLLGLE